MSGVARDRPSPYGEGAAVFRLRNRPDTVARGPVPRDRSTTKAIPHSDRGTARDRPSPYGDMADAA